VGVNFHYLSVVIVFFLSSPFFLCLAMIVWFVTRKHMWIQVRTSIL